MWIEGTLIKEIPLYPNLKDLIVENCLVDDLSVCTKMKNLKYLFPTRLPLSALPDYPQSTIEEFDLVSVIIEKCPYISSVPKIYADLPQLEIINFKAWSKKYRDNNPDQKVYVPQEVLSNIKVKHGEGIVFVDQPPLKQNRRRSGYFRTNPEGTPPMLRIPIPTRHDEDMQEMADSLQSSLSSLNFNVEVWPYQLGHELRVTPQNSMSLSQFASLLSTKLPLVLSFMKKNLVSGRFTKQKFQQLNRALLMEMHKQKIRK